MSPMRVYRKAARLPWPLIGYGVLIAFVSFALWSQRQDRIANIERLNKINTAQCSSGDRLRQLYLSDQRSQLAESQQYLRDHPNGAPGIPRDLIQRGIERTAAKIRKLERPFCPESPTLSTSDALG